ncbi:molybdenum cofactor guanylyltransferase [Aureibacillus halotolerans]|uniref:Probable molybdenum cofactor guanylyltransferase n=1 Tax=Aureibacillus halotolerans TaxID=1508390 RepID=A0A4R6U775_9BACI|nr:molybdenum cofactor guanylyltransferase [Aureibacillus halotolerans]TDQ40743.1 molybdenum cofactor guanylyltransferase [Aureibacillus halotolerans]
MKLNVMGVVLAGGLSSRFGSPKPFAKTQGKFFYEFAVEAISSLVDETIVVTNEGLQDQFINRGVSCLVDVSMFRQQGPLAGLYTAMEHREADWYIVVPSDLPRMTTAVFTELKANACPSCDAIIPMVNEVAEPLVGLYAAQVKPVIKRQLKGGKRSVHKMLNELRVRYVRFDDAEAFQNINTPADYECMERED